MFGSLVRALNRGNLTAKAVGVLLKTYGVSLDSSGRTWMRHTGTDLAEYYNEHELAVTYLVELVGRLSPADPSARTRVTNLIKLAKGAQARKLIIVERPLEQLAEVARTRFQIDACAVTAA